MRQVRLLNETDWEGWRAATRALVLAGVPPEAVDWAVDPRNPAMPPAAAGSFGISRALVLLAAQAIQARTPDRFDVLYRLVWRAHAGEAVLEDRSLPETARARALALAVRAEAHRMRTHLRYASVAEEGGTRWLGWYAPAHHVLQANAQLLAQRFSASRASILTPEGSAHWGEGALRFGPGVDAAVVSDDDALRSYWDAFGAEVLQASREGTEIPPAEALDEAPRPPDRAPIGPVVLRQDTDPALAGAAEEAASCRRCPLWEPATQTAFGEGPAGARIMFIGEQPGDQEDVIGRPFVGPAGQLLDRALEEAGIDRRRVYITNAVKHFKFIPRGKRRLHQTPEAPEVEACRFWLDVERVRLRPRLLVLLGATAARAVLQRPVTISRTRGEPIRLSDAETAFVTVHPSYLLRVQGEAAQEREYRAFVADLRKAAALAAAE